MAVEEVGSGPMASQHAIELRGLSRHYGDVAAVDDVTLAITGGEFFTLLGPSGCGKSTTLRVVAGLEDPTGGTVMLEGRDVTALPPEGRDVSMVFQDYALFPHMTLLENVSFPLKMKRVPKREARARASEILDMMGLVKLRDRRPHQISGGQRQRAALARSLVWRPRALLLDEPLAALDFQLRLEMQGVLKDLQRRVGITFLYVTHDQTEAFSMSDRIGVMRDGRLEQVGTPEELYHRPRSLFVATFIGRMNLLGGRVVGREDEAIRVDVDGAMLFARVPEWPVVVGDEVVLGVRPEFVQWIEVPKDSMGGENVLACDVRQITFQGALVETAVEIVGGRRWRCISMSDAPTGELGTGERALTWDRKRSWLFRKEALTIEGAVSAEDLSIRAEGAEVVG